MGTRGAPKKPHNPIPVPTLLGCAWMERAVRTDSTLKRKGRRPWKASFTLAPRQAGFAEIQRPSVFCGMRLSRMAASPLGWAPIHSWGEVWGGLMGFGLSHPLRGDPGRTDGRTGGGTDGLTSA